MDVRAELKKLDELRTVLLQQLRGEDHITELEKAQLMVKPGSKAHERLLSAGYDGLTREDAERVIAERDEEPTRWPFAEYQKAKAFLAALEAKPQVLSERPPWRVRSNSRAVQ